MNSIPDRALACVGGLFEWSYINRPLHWQYSSLHASFSPKTICHSLSVLRILVRFQYAQFIQDSHVHCLGKIQKIDWFLPKWVCTTNCTLEIISDKPMRLACLRVCIVKDSLPMVAYVWVVRPAVLKRITLYPESFLLWWPCHGDCLQF